MRMFKRLLIVLAVLGICRERSQAQPTTWFSSGMGGGGAFFSPSISPHNANHLYVATDMTSLFHSTNRGVTWETVDFRTIQTSGIYGNVQFTNNPSVQYAVTNLNEYPKAVKTINGGASWDATIADPTGGGAYTLIADHENSNLLLLTDYYHLYVSVNGGNTFNAIDSTQSANGYLLAGACFSGNIVCVGTNQGLLVSTDGGANFSKPTIPGMQVNDAIVSLSGGAQGQTIRLVAVTMGKNKIYPGITGGDHNSYSGVYTLDLSLTPSWTSRSAGIPTGVHPVYAAMCPSNPAVMYVAGGSTAGTPTVYKSTDGGATWASVFNTTNNQNIATGWSGDGGDRDWSYGEYALGLSVSPSDVDQVMITDLGFVHHSSNGGASWQQVYCSPADQNQVGQRTPTGKAYHGNGLENTSWWHVEWIDSLHIVGCATDIRGTRTVDGGATWSQDYTGHTLNTMYYSVYSPARLTTYAATSSIHDIYQSTRIFDSPIDNGTGQVLYSLDSGHVWQVLHDFGHPVIWLALDPSNSSRLYASVVSSTDGGIYVSNNIQNGSSSTWTKLAAPPRTEGHAYTIRVLNDGNLLATYSAHKPTKTTAFTASSGVFLSTNRGVTWIDRSDDAMKYWTHDVVVDPHDPTQNNWYAGVYSGWGGPPNGLGGLYHTTNRGLSWTKILTTDGVTSCAIHPDDPTVMYVTTETNGLLYTSNLTATTPTFKSIAGYPFKQPQRVYFNPYNHGQLWVTSFGNGLRYSGSIALPPLAPALLSPDDKATGVHLTDTLRWESVARAQSYNLQIAKDSLFTKMVTDTTGIREPNHRLNSMSWNTLYYWRVQAVGATGTSAWSERRSYRIEQLNLLTPFRVLLNAPQDYTNFTNTPPNRLNWHPTQPAVDRYAVELATDSLFTTAMVDTSLTDTLRNIADWMAIGGTNSYWWRVRAHNLAGWGIYSDTWHFTFQTVGVYAASPVPVDAALQQNTPNPFVDETTLRFSLAAPMPVTLNVYDIVGRLVDRGVAGVLPAGAHAYVFRADGLRTGVYVARLVTPAGVISRSMMLVR